MKTGRSLYCGKNRYVLTRRAFCVDNSLEVKRPNKYQNTIKQQVKQQQKQDMFGKNLKWAGIGATCALTAMFLLAKLIELFSQEPIPTFNSYGHSIGDVANFIGCPTAIVEVVNDADENDILDKVVIPQPYTKIDEEIAMLIDKTRQVGLAQDEVDKINTKLNSLKEKKVMQEKLGKAYIDPEDDMDYILWNDTCKAEDVKYAWGVKDGVLRKYNELEFTYGSKKLDGFGAETNYFKDYTNSYVSGCIKLPAKYIAP